MSVPSGQPELPSRRTPTTYVHGAGTSTQPRSQVALPDDAVDVDASHSKHCVMLVVEENLPTLHAKQSELFTCEENLPSLHCMHVRDPGDAADPGAQPVQTELAKARLTPLAFPAGHAEQLELFT